MTPASAVGQGFSRAQPTGSTSSRALGREVAAPFSGAAVFGRAGVDPARATPSGRAVAASFPEAAPTAPVPTAPTPDTGSTAEATA
ncbi:hypothetical protein [Amycolatopsis sp. NBC_01286]|uniref:hypothetical protein n=1 Tax=Amycolatopsis sp. NBC_01286 TaxID=2903560 RepID=UPI002E1590E1|nr:hypothetical protein OG570_01460 [Amycolatopsis sp. NBC_01286]